MGQRMGHHRLYSNKTHRIKRPHESLIRKYHPKPKQNVFPLLNNTCSSRRSPILCSSTITSPVLHHPRPAEKPGRCCQRRSEKVDRAVSDAAVAGIDKGVEIKDKAASVAGVETNKAEGKAAEVAGEAKGKAHELSGQAKGKAE